MAAKARRHGRRRGTRTAYNKEKMFAFYLGTVAKLRRDWDAFALLFLDRGRRLDLSAYAPELSDCISTVLTVSIYMDLAHLFDPLATFNDPSKCNLVLRRVIDDLAPTAGTPERIRIESEYKAMEPMVALVRKWRNAVGAHRSLTTSLALADYARSGCKLPHPLPRIPLMQLRDALQSLVRITDLLVAHVSGGSRKWYEPKVGAEIKQLFAALAKEPD